MSKIEGEVFKYSSLDNK